MRKCKDGILNSYLKYVEEQESPTAFHQWVILSVVGAALGRNIWLDRGYYTIFPNLFVILVAGSAKCKKSTSLGLGINLLKSIAKPPMIFSQKITNEALIQALVESRENDSSSGLVYASELSVFIGIDAQKSGLIPTLTDLYDSPSDWSYRTRGRGIEQMKNVTISILAGSTKDWLRTSIPAEAVGGGFTSRIIFVYQNAPRRANLFPSMNDHAHHLKLALIDDLNHLRTVNGGMMFSKEAKEKAEEWYHKELFISRDPKVEGYYARKHDTMFKVATILSLMESDQRVIEKEHIEKALAMLAHTEGDLTSIMDSVVAAPVGGMMEQILEIVRRDRAVTHSDLLKKCWRFATATDVSMYIRTLIDGKEVKETISADGKTRHYEVF
jgi:hypothetical protein